MLDQQGQRRVLRQQGVDPLTVEALEVVATHVLTLKVGRESRANGGDLLHREHLLEHDEAFALDGRDASVGCGVGRQVQR